MEQKNFLVAIGLIVGFLVLWTMFIVPRFNSPTQPPIAANTMEPNGSSSTGSMAQPIGAMTPKSAEPINAHDTILRNETNEIVLTPKGGAVKSWTLLSKGQEVDLVLHPDQAPLPLATFPDAFFNIHVKGPSAVMQATLDNGVQVTKTLTLSPAGHLHVIEYRFRNTTGHSIELPKWEWGWGTGLGTSATEMKENPSQIRALTLGKLKVKVLKSTEQAEFGRWAAIDNRYYLAAFIPKTVHPVGLAVAGTKEETRLQLVETLQLPAHGESKLDYELYAGPKGYTQLTKYDKGLEASVNFGIFSGLGKIILKALYYFKAVTGNFGFAIIILTICIQTLMLPLTMKSFKATLAMKQLQPKIAEIQARFKGDPKRLNVEMMNVYKTSGTNPFGGCLPMVLQLPIFWALFTTLRNAYELRGAPFVGWVHDLAAPDVLFQVGSFPFHALPIIMGGAMFLQQRMAGAPSDPMQKQMMTMMPIMFTFMFYGFPSGLVLYWLTNNLMTMASQYSFQKFGQKPSNIVNTTIVK